MDSNNLTYFNRYWNSVSDCNPFSYPDTSQHKHTYGDGTLIHSYSHIYIDIYRNTYADSNCYGLADANTHSDTNEHRDCNIHSDVYSNIRANIQPYCSN